MARLIGLSCGDALWISFSISQARKLSGLLRKIMCILLAVLILLLAIYKHLIPPTTGFFNCYDPNIWLPYKGDTFSTKILISVVFLSFFVFVSNYNPQCISKVEELNFVHVEYHWIVISSKELDSLPNHWQKYCFHLIDDQCH